MFALNFELLPRDTVYQGGGGRGDNSAASCPLAASLKMLATAEAACHPLRHCATQRKWTLCHGSAQAEAAAVAGESCKLTPAKWKMEMEKESQGKERKRKERKGFSKRSNTQVETVANRSEAKQNETKSKRIETDRKQQQSEGRRRGRGKVGQVIYAEK